MSTIRKPASGLGAVLLALAAAGALTIATDASAQSSGDPTATPVTHADQKAAKEQAKADRKRADAQADAEKERADARVKDAKDQ
ncbi:hypothetical protein [Paraburkholderia humisilvae]|uniref:Uncharacterized protein n=1 Tax=Paraburkholderia humisilvae TaxID=627669 RepID=A0A6J5EXT3_9BURK|nr:hypothetical protein [Paraburkholderia humisilvae]CAB3771409.1 hypothetical protein LMG29542_06616 [Paraburkholderia humisilvae]